MLTAVVITRNEAGRIGRCLGALGFCDEILVLDSGSDDGTPALARAAGAKVVETDWPGFVAQKSRALSLAKGDWVLSVDADEVVDAQLAQSILQAVSSGEHDGYQLSRRNIWLGHRLSAGFAWPDQRVRLVRRGMGEWGGRDPHDRLQVKGKIGVLSGELVHDSYRSLADHLARIERYSAIDARQGSGFDLLFRPLWHVFSALVLRRGVRDGWPGVFYAGLGGLYVALKWGRWRIDAEARSAAS